MKWLGRSLVFALAISIGLAASWVGALFNTRLDVPDLTEGVSWRDLEPQPSLQRSGMTVAYAGTGSVDGQPYLNFIVHNGLDRPVMYTAYAGDPEGPLAYEKVNKTMFDNFWFCGTGLIRFTIRPSETALVKVYPWEVQHLPKNGQSYSIGFKLGQDNDDAKVFYSEPFKLPEEFRMLAEARIPKYVP